MNLQVILLLSTCCILSSSEPSKRQADETGSDDPNSKSPDGIVSEEKTDDLLPGPENLKHSKDSEEKTDTDDPSQHTKDGVVSEEKKDTDDLLPGPDKLSAKLMQDRKTAAELQAKIEAIHKDDPKSPMQLAQRTLMLAFEKFNKGIKSFKVTDLLRYQEGVPNGKVLLFTFRLIELMDINKDYTITKEEFVQTFSGAMAEPTKLIELMFNIQDYSGDGTINRYEWWQTESISLGINYNLFDSWTKIASQGIDDMDINKDRVVDLSEYMSFVVFQINNAIVQQRTDSKPS